MHTLNELRSGQLVDAKHLRLSCALTEFPQEIFLLAESLEVLDLSGNRLSSLPADFWKFSKLKILFMSDNLFTELPEVLSNCPVLEMIGFKSNQIVEVPELSIPASTRWLILTNNKIKKLPASLGKCSKLQKVALAGNRLTALPEEMVNCNNLELLRISANLLITFPRSLLGLPKLSWLAFSGNPFCKKYDKGNGLNEISWKEFDVSEQLGEGASGNIYKALWHTTDFTKDVALKIFKGEVTSDGLPGDEMQAAILAGSHPGFVKLFGKIVDHPQQKQGLVMELIPPNYKNLGQPPSLETCSRDTFLPSTTFRLEEVLKIAKTVASAAAQLHQNGMMHGDLYAHNILVDRYANCLFTDFGATSFYALDDPWSINLQYMEARAFGCLLDDLLTRVDRVDAEDKLIIPLLKLRDELLNENPAARVLFKEIVSRLGVL